MCLLLKWMKGTKRKRQTACNLKNCLRSCPWKLTIAEFINKALNLWNSLARLLIRRKTAGNSALFWGSIILNTREFTVFCVCYCIFSEKPISALCLIELEDKAFVEMFQPKRIYRFSPDLPATQSMSTTKYSYFNWLMLWIV